LGLATEHHELAQAFAAVRPTGRSDLPVAISNRRSRACKRGSASRHAPLSLERRYQERHRLLAAPVRGDMSVETGICHDPLRSLGAD
jgi:hypothetical protein